MVVLQRGLIVVCDGQWVRRLDLHFGKAMSVRLAVHLLSGRPNNIVDHLRQNSGVSRLVHCSTQNHIHANDLLLSFCAFVHPCLGVVCKVQAELHVSHVKM